jgi:hypothetical protein
MERFLLACTALMILTPAQEYVRSKIVRSVNSEDWLMLVSMVRFPGPDKKKHATLYSSKASNSLSVNSVQRHVITVIPRFHPLDAD